MRVGAFLHELNSTYMKDEIITAYMRPESVEGDPYLRVPTQQDKDPATKVIDRETQKPISLWIHKLLYPYKTHVSYTVFAVTRAQCYIFPLKMDEDGTYCWNGSNIPSILWGILGISQHSPEGLQASLAHDNLLQYKKHFYEIAKSCNKNITPEEFRELTTEICKEILKNHGVSKLKADLMGFFINLYQSILNGKAWKELD